MIQLQTTVSKMMAVILAFPHLVSVMNSEEGPSFLYFVMTSASIYILYMYMRRIENCGPTSGLHKIAAATMPIVSAMAIFMYVGLLAANVEKSESDEEQPLGSSLGIVYQYRMDDVVEKFRDIVSTKQEYENVSPL
jgi:hypothetical protein